MVKLDNVTEGVLDVINDNKFSQTGAFNLRENGTSICHGDSEHIKIKKKTDKPGIDIYIDGKTDGEAVYIPVVLSKSGMTDLVYNDFYVEDGADVRIVAGCGIHNSGCNESRHDGIHTFHVGKNANVRYEEKHYGEGNGTGARVLNPVTNIFVGENSVFTLDTAQIKGVDSTVRETNVELGKDAKLYVTERLMTDGEQKAESNIEVQLNGEDSSAQIVSRSVGKGNSVQTFHPNALLMLLLLPGLVAAEDDFDLDDILSDADPDVVKNTYSQPGNADDILLDENNEPVSIYEEDGSILITLTATGDFTVGGDSRKSTSIWMNELKKHDNDYNFALANVRDIFLADDLTIVNFEGTLTDSTYVPSEKRNNEFLFSASPDHVSMLVDNGIEAVALENNHVLDHGQAVYEETQQHLDDAGIVWSNSTHVGVM